jgi:hypothetical protein
MAENQEQTKNNTQSEKEETGQTTKSDSQTGDPGRTPGKAEGEDDSSATSGNGN